MAKITNGKLQIATNISVVVMVGAGIWWTATTTQAIKSDLCHIREMMTARFEDQGAEIEELRQSNHQIQENMLTKEEYDRLTRLSDSRADS